MSILEIKHAIREMSPEDRQEIQDLLQEIEPVGGPVPGFPPVVVSFEDASNAVFRKHQEVLHRLAQ